MLELKGRKARRRCCGRRVLRNVDGRGLTSRLIIVLVADVHAVLRHSAYDHASGEDPGLILGGPITVIAVVEVKLEVRRICIWLV